MTPAEFIDRVYDWVSQTHPSTIPLSWIFGKETQQKAHISVTGSYYLVYIIY